MLDDLFLCDYEENLSITYRQLLDCINDFEIENKYISFMYCLITSQDIDLTGNQVNISNNHLKLKNLEEMQSMIKNSDSKIILKSSGTTGDQKIIIHDIQKILKNTKKIDEKCVWGMCYNFNHMGGIQIILQSFVNFNGIVVLYQMTKKQINELINSHNITHISATPTFYRINFQSKNVHNCVKRVTLGGELSQKEDIQKIKKIFPNAKINNIYATTETGIVMTSNTEIFKLADNIKIIDKSLKILFSGKWLDTDDVVEMIDENHFYFLGRGSGFLNIGGYKVSSDKIEGIIREIETVENALVYLKENSIIPILCCDIITSESHIKDLQLRKFLKQRGLNKYEIPRIFKKTDNIETTNNLKIKRRKN